MYRQRNKLITRYRGLSTDDKPQGAEHGSSFHEMDTGTIYYFDQEHEEWYEAPGSRKFEPEEKTAAGSVASFETDLVRPMRSVTVQMEPIQEGSGDPSPDNVRPISGRSEVGVWRSGVNVWDEEWENGTVNHDTGEKEPSTVTIRPKNYISVLPNTQYYCNKFVDNTGVFNFYFYDADYNYVGHTNDAGSGTFTTPSKARYMLFRTYNAYGSTYANNISINYPSTDHDYHASDIASITIPLGQTVYGGTVDLVSGVMTVDRAMVALDARGAISWNKSSNYPGGFYFDTDVFVNYYHVAPRKNTPFLCSHAKTVDNISDYVNGTCYCDGSINIRIMSADTTVAQWVEYLVAQNTAGTPVEICCYLAQPVSVQLTAQQLTTLLGTNNVWSDGGDVTVKYIAKKGE